MNFLCSMRESPGLTAEDVLAAVTTMSFDIAALELYLPLMVGARIELVSRATATDGPALAQLLVASGATVLQATPATWRMLLEAGWRGRPGFRALCGGEPLPRDLADAVLTRVDKLWNLYGPTETTVWSTLDLVERDGAADQHRPPDRQHAGPYPRPCRRADADRRRGRDLHRRRGRGDGLSRSARPHRRTLHSRSACLNGRARGCTGPAIWAAGARTASCSISAGSIIR